MKSFLFPQELLDISREEVKVEGAGLALEMGEGLTHSQVWGKSNFSELML